MRLLKINQEQLSKILKDNKLELIDSIKEKPAKSTALNSIHTTFTCSKDIHDKLYKLSTQSGVSRSAIIRSLVEKASLSDALSGTA